MAKKPEWKMQVHQLERVNKKKHEYLDKNEEHYRFSLQVGPIFINGLIYRRESGAILSPQYRIQGWRKANVLNFTGGAHAMRVRNMVEEEIVRREEFRRQQLEQELALTP